MHDSPRRHHDDDDYPDDYPDGGHDYHDGQDDIAALDFSPPLPQSDETALDAFDGFAAPASHSDAGDWSYPEETQDADRDQDLDDDDDDDDDDALVSTFTVTNPPGTVEVTAFADGRVRHIQLFPKVNTLTEVSLAEEIMLVARLATQEARAGQFSAMLEGLRLQGHDGVTTRDFLQRDLDLPTPEQAAEERAAAFEQRYAGRHE